MNDSKTVVGKAEAVSKSMTIDPTAAKARTSASLGSPEELRQTIEVLAYCRAERRNFEPGHEVEDWLVAEAQVLAEAEGLKGFPA